MVPKQIKNYLTSLPELKGKEMHQLHQMILKQAPACKLWFLDGKNSDNKIVANPNIGYGSNTIKYANGTSAESFKIGLCATKTGISVYILGITNKTYLSQTFGKEIGNAKVTGYCIAFKSLKDIDIKVLESVVKYGFETMNS